MVNDPIADLLTRVRNAELAKHSEVLIPHSVMKEAVLQVMKKYNYIKSYTEKKIAGKVYSNILIELDTDKLYRTYYKRISKPGQRMYVSAENVKPVKNGLGISVLSTSKGVMSNVEASKQKIGGELLCEIW
jgi:small subunit ribosomal protein S8